MNNHGGIRMVITISVWYGCKRCVMEHWQTHRYYITSFFVLFLGQSSVTRGLYCHYRSLKFKLKFWEFGNLEYLDTCLETDFWIVLMLFFFRL